jgi:hypothetical protein
LHGALAMMTLQACVLSLAILAAPRAVNADVEPRGDASDTTSASPSSELIMDLLDLRPTFDALEKKDAAALGAAEREALRKTARSRLLNADADVAQVVARVDHERDQVADLTQWYDDRTSARVTRLTIAGAVFAIGATVGTGMTLKSDLVQAGTWVTTITSGLSAILTIGSVLPVWDTAPVGIDDNVLAPLFGMPSRKAYPPFLARLAAASPPPLERPLVAHWRAMGWLPQPPKDREVIVAVTSRTSPGQKIDLGALSIRSRLLDHTRSELIKLHGQLLTIVEKLMELP